MPDIQDDIILSFNRGEESAFNAIYKYYYREICFFATKLTGNKEEAKDIAIRTFTSLFRLHESFDTLINIKAFLYITTRNNCFNYLKSEKRNRNRLKKIVELEEMSAAFENDPSIQHAIVEVTVLKEIYVAVEELPTECRRIFKLLFYEGLKPAEISARLSITPETVRSQKRRALELLRIRFANNELVVAVLFCLSLMDYGTIVNTSPIFS